MPRGRKITRVIEVEEIRLRDAAAAFFRYKKDGWFRQTAADNLAFVDMQNRICYIIKTKELRDYVEGVITSVAQGGYVYGVKDKTLNGYWCLLINVNNLDFYKMAV